MKNIVSFSGGKDSTAMLLKMIENKINIDGIVFAKVMATPTINGEFEAMYEYISKVEDYIKRDITVVKSDMSFDEQFYTKKLKGNHIGDIYGYPFTVGAWCNSKLKMQPLNKHFAKCGDCCQFVGIAKDEPKRLLRQANKKNHICYLDVIGYTEKDCINYLQDKNLMNPLYKNHKRLGCWFCVKQSIADLRYLYNNHPVYWKMLQAWELDSRIPFSPNWTIAELTNRFILENRQTSLFDKEQKFFDIVPLTKK